MRKVRNRLLAVTMAAIFGVGSVPFSVRAEELAAAVGVTEVSSDISGDVYANAETDESNTDMVAFGLNDTLVDEDNVGEETASEDGSVTKENTVDLDIAESYENTLDVSETEENTEDVYTDKEDEDLNDETAGTNMVEINETNFPDYYFRVFLSEAFDDDDDGWLDANKITDIETGSRNYTVEYNDDYIHYVTGISSGSSEYSENAHWAISNVTDLTGIELFPNLKTLIWNAANPYELWYSVKVENIDLSKNTSLEKLVIANNNLSSLDVSANTELTYLSCEGNNLSSLDVSANTELTCLSCGGNNLSSLDVSANTELTYLSCAGNNLSSLDVGKNTKLTSLSCGGTGLSSLDVSQNTDLTYLSCTGTALSSLDVSKNTKLEEVDCHSNSNLSSLDVSACTNLTKLSCYSNSNLISLDVGGCANLIQLYCYDNNLSSLDVSKNIMLKGLDCRGNSLSSLNLSDNTDLRGLDCSDNNLTGIDLSNCLQLYYLACEDNKISELALTENTALWRLECAGNYLTSLDLSSNLALTRLDYTRNYIKEVVYPESDEAMVYIYGDSQYVAAEISLDKKSLSIELEADAAEKLTATVTPEDATYTDVIWTSSDDKVAAVDSNGNVTAVSLGKAIITATSADGIGNSASCEVTVATIGDLNNDGNIDLLDLMSCLNHVSKKKILTDTAYTSADIDGDGDMDLFDLMRLLNYVSGKSNTL